ncbi:hypothetical protein BG006_005052, partial [Podila minutissima]
PNAPDIVEKNQFESDKPDDIKSFTEMLSYWEKQSSKGGEIAKQITQIRHSMGLEKEDLEMASPNQTPNGTGSSGSHGSGKGVKGKLDLIIPRHGGGGDPGVPGG